MIEHVCPISTRSLVSNDRVRNLWTQHATSFQQLKPVNIGLEYNTKDAASSKRDRFLQRFYLNGRILSPLHRMSNTPPRECSVYRDPFLVTELRYNVYVYSLSIHKNTTRHKNDFWFVNCIYSATLAADDIFSKNDEEKLQKKIFGDWRWKENKTQYRHKTQKW